MIDGKGEALISQILALAETGDKEALKWCLDRLVPPLRSVDEFVSVRTPRDASLALIGEQLLVAALHSRITPDQASKLLSGLSAHARVVEVSELEERVSRLENTGHEGDWTTG